MLRIKSMFVLIALPVFIYVDAVQAKLITSGDGRPTLSRQFPTTLIYVEDRYLNDQGVVADDPFGGSREFDTTLWGGIRNPAFEASGSNIFLNNVGNSGIRLNDNIGARATKFGEGFGVGVFPSGTFDDGTRCYRDGGNVSVLEEDRRLFEEQGFTVGSYLDEDGNPPTVALDGADFVNDYNRELEELNRLQGRIDDATVSEPCKWQYTVGQELSIFGFYQWLLRNEDGSINSDIDYDVNYLIANDFYQGTLNTETSSVGLTLAGDALDHLAPGEYNIRAEVTVSSSKGKFFTTVDDPDEFNNLQFQFDPTCVNNPQYQSYQAFLELNSNLDFEIAEQRWIAQNGAIPDEFTCGRKVANDGGAGTTRAPSTSEFFWSATERLIIVASDSTDEPDVRVSSPGSLSLLLLGVSLIYIRTFKRKA